MAGAGPSAFFRTTQSTDAGGEGLASGPPKEDHGGDGRLTLRSYGGGRCVGTERVPLAGRLRRTAERVRRTPRGAALIPLENWRVGASQWLPSLRGSLHFRAGEVDRIVGPRVVRIFPLNPPKTPGPPIPSGRDPAWRSLCLEGRRGMGAPLPAPSASLKISGGPVRLQQQKMLPSGVRPCSRTGGRAVVGRW